MNLPDVTYSADCYRFLWKEDGVDMIVDRLSEERDGLKCELTVSTSRAPLAGLLREGRFNLSSATTRSQWEKALADRFPDFDWYAALEQVCALTRRRWRDGEPVIDLATVELSAELPYLIHPYMVDGGVTVFFADGGSGKSLFVLALAVSIGTGVEVLPGIMPTRHGPVLYLDWEWDESSHAERLAAICAGVGIEVPKETIFYRHEQASVIESAATIRRRVGELGAVAVMVDSLGMARGGEPESADLTIRTFAAMRSFGVPVGAVDHIAKHATDRTQSFGSVYTKNAARMMWRMDAVKEEGHSQISIGLANTKANRKTQRPRGYQVDMEIDDDERLSTVTFTAVDPNAVPGLTRGLPLHGRMEGILRQNGALELQDIVMALEAEGWQGSVATARMTLNRHKRKFIHLDTGKWGVKWQD